MKIKKNYNSVVFKKNNFFIIIAVLVYFGVFFFTPDLIDFQIRSTLAIMAVAITLWVLEPIPMALTALIVVVGLVITGAASLENALSGFSSGSILLITAGFMMAEVINSTPLSNRIAYFFLTKTKSTPAGILASLLFIMGVLTFFIPAGAVRVALLLPVVLTIIENFELIGPTPNIKKMLLLGVAFGANITGLGLLPGAVTNVIAADLLHQVTGYSITYVTWMFFALPVTIILLPVVWLVLTKCFLPEVEDMPGGQKIFKEKLRELGPVSVAEKKCATILFLTLALWMTESWHGFHSSVSATISVILMCLPIIGCGSWKKAKQISWETIILVATTLSLGNVANQGAAQLIASSLFGIDAIAGIFLYPFLTVILLTLFTQVYHLAIGNSATVIITLVPIVYQITLQFGRDPFLIVLATGIASLFGFIFVIETLPNMMVYNTGLIDRRDFVFPGIILTVLVSIAMGAVVTVWWPIVVKFFSSY